MVRERATRTGVCRKEPQYRAQEGKVLPDLLNLQKLRTKNLT